MKKLIPLAFVFGLFLVQKPVMAQSLIQSVQDSTNSKVKVTEYDWERIKQCRIDSQYPLMPIIAAAPINATIIHTGYKNQKLQIVSNRNFRNREMAWKAY